MGSPDYAQKLTDHQSFLVLVKPLGRRIGASDYGRIYERICTVQRVCIPADPRCMMVRYKHEYKPEDNDWGDFQFHRRVLGLLCIVQYHAGNPLHEVEAHYNSIKSLYGTSLFDSRLILLGVASVADLPDIAVAAAGGGSISGDLPMKADHFGKPNEASDAADASLAWQQDASDPTGRAAASLPQTESSAMRHRKLLSDVTAKQLLCYESAEVCLECIADDVRDFACSLFYILDSKRISASKLQVVERQPQLLMAPYERRDVAHLDIESKLFKKRYIGRQKKHLGDLCLLAALYSEACSNYSMALDILKSADDFLWVAGALEGLCCAAFFVNYPSMPEKSPQQFPRNRSFSTKRGPSNLFQNFGLKPPGSFTSVPESVGLDLAGPKLRNIFLADEIGERYREAIQQYSKFRPAATVLELEACIKASRILILQGKRWEVCEFLQRVACVNWDYYSEEKIARWSALADLYGEIGFLRKAAFYKRLAAMECGLSCLVSSTPLPVGSSAVPPPRAIWQQCRAMLLQSFPGYKLSLCLKDYDSPTMVGWPALRHCVLSELIHAALEIGDCRASIEYLCAATHVLFERLSPNELKEMSALIEENATLLAEEHTAGVTALGAQLSSATGGGPLCASTTAQLMCFSFTKIPVLYEVKVEKLPPHMTPVRRQSDQASSVFIYTPLEKGLGKRKQKKGPMSTGLTWVEGDFSEVELHVYNPMPYELKLTNIGLLTEGVDFESHPSGHSLPADSGPHLIKVVGTPKSSGTLIIKGYTCSLLGVRSNCLFADLPRLKEASDGGYSVDVSPALPRLHVSECGGLPRSPYLVTGGNSELHASAVLRLLYGERKEVSFRLRNVGCEKVEWLELALDGKRRAGGGQRLLQWDASSLDSQLPIESGAEALLTIVADTGCVDPTDAASWSAVPLQPLERNPSAAARERTDSRSSSSLLECTVKVKYSGGRGMAAGYYRQCVIAVDVVLDPSVDVLSKRIVSSSVDEFALVVDVVNRSNMTLDLRLPSAPASLSSSSIVCLRPMDTASVTLAGTKCDFFATDAEVGEHLLSLLQVWWSSSSMAEGRLPSAHLRWSTDELAAARRPAVLLDVGFAFGAATLATSGAAASTVEAGAEPRFGVGAAVGVVVELRNRCSQALTNATVKIDVHQSVAALSTTSTPVVPSAIDSGFCVVLEQSTVQVKHCDSGSRHAAVKTLVAFCPGRYVLRATCVSSSDVVLSKSAGLDFCVD